MGDKNFSFSGNRNKVTQLLQHYQKVFAHFYLYAMESEMHEEDTAHNLWTNDIWDDLTVL